MKTPVRKSGTKASGKTVKTTPGSGSGVVNQLQVGERKAEVRSSASKELAAFANPNPERDFQIHMQIPEFTCLCPLTGQPDFATFTLDYVPDQKCVELKSLKMYMWSYRNEGAFHEKVTNAILEDLVKAVSPRFMRLIAQWNVRGGIYTNVVVEHRKKGWTPSAELVEFSAAAPTAAR
jgi:7-cyano-7-deazaguanine reductase